MFGLSSSLVRAFRYPAPGYLDELGAAVLGPLLRTFGTDKSPVGTFLNVLTEAFAVHQIILSGFDKLLHRSRSFFRIHFHLVLCLVFHHT